MTREVHGIQVIGIELDPSSRCAHYHSNLDIVSIKAPCCASFFACHQCHEELADHPLQSWSKDDLLIEAVLCGACGYLLTISEYLDCASSCPSCGAQFNPGCLNHKEIYFGDC